MSLVPTMFINRRENCLFTPQTGMGNLQFLPEFRFFFLLFGVENIAFFSGNSNLISSLQGFFFHCAYPCTSNQGQGH